MEIKYFQMEWVLRNSEEKAIETFESEYGKHYQTHTIFETIEVSFFMEGHV